MTPQRDPPPVLAPEETPSTQEVAQIAHKMLSEIAKGNPMLADKMRALGIPPDWDPPIGNKGDA